VTILTERDKIDSVIPYRALTEDGRRNTEIRAAKRDARLTYLERNRDILVPGGALLARRWPVQHRQHAGAQRRVREAAEAFSANEPFRRAGLFTSVRITRMRRGHWNPNAAPKTAEGS
jgi:uncharacterized protein YciI